MAKNEEDGLVKIIQKIFRNLTLAIITFLGCIAPFHDFFTVIQVFYLLIPYGFF